MLFRLLAGPDCLAHSNPDHVCAVHAGCSHSLRHDCWGYHWNHGRRFVHKAEVTEWKEQAFYGERLSLSGNSSSELAKPTDGYDRCIAIDFFIKEPPALMLITIRASAPVNGGALRGQLEFVIGVIYEIDRKQFFKFI